MVVVVAVVVGRKKDDVELNFFSTMDHDLQLTIRLSQHKQQ